MMYGLRSAWNAESANLYAGELSHCLSDLCNYMKRDPKGIFFSSPPSAWFSVWLIYGIPIITIIFAITVHNFPAKRQMRRQISTMDTMKIIGERLEQLRSPVGYPDIQTINELANLDPALPIKDGWNQSFQLVSGSDAYYLISAGKDGRFEQGDPRLYQSGSTLSFEEDIVYSNSRFIRRPEGAKE